MVLVVHISDRYFLFWLVLSTPWFFFQATFFDGYLRPWTWKMFARTYGSTCGACKSPHRVRRIWVISASINFQKSCDSSFESSQRVQYEYPLGFKFTTVFVCYGTTKLVLNYRMNVVGVPRTIHKFGCIFTRSCRFRFVLLLMDSTHVCHVKTRYDVMDWFMNR